jgi:hypothetical protein
MSPIYETIKRDSLTARKTGNKATASLLVTLASEIQAAGRSVEERENPSNDVTIATIKKFIKNAEASGVQVLSAQRPGYIDAFGAIKAELDILETYLPKQLTEDEIKVIIAGLRAKPGEANIMEPTMGNIMGYFKTMYPGRYDGALVSKHAR